MKKSAVPEQRSLSRAAVVDHVLRFGAYGAVLTSGILLPNLVKSLDGPLRKLDKQLDEKARRREILKTVYYMKSRGYLAGEYEHGLQLTGAGKRRLKRVELSELKIVAPPQWDSIWRIVFYDIPESHRSGRQALAAAMHTVGCFQLQKSVWVTPFPCRDVIETLAASYDIDQYITCIEATYLDNAAPLKARFAKKYPQTSFSGSKAGKN